MGMLQKKENKGLTYYEVMHGNRKIAEINTRGEAVILALQFFLMIFIWRKKGILTH